MSNTYTLFQAKTALALAIFSDIRQLRERRTAFSQECPYVISEDDLHELCDTSRWPIIKRLAHHQRFPFDIQRLTHALERGRTYERTLMYEQTLTVSDPKYQSSRMHLFQMLSLMGRMCKASPHYGEIAFGLTQPEIRALQLASDVSFFEAAASVRLSFRTDPFKDILRQHSQAHAQGGSLSSALEHVLGISGLRRLRGGI